MKYKRTILMPAEMTGGDTSLMKNTKIDQKSFQVALKKVYKSPYYFFLSLAVFAVTLIFAIWLPNLHFITNMVSSPTLSIQQKANFLISSLGALDTNFTHLSRSLTITISALFGIYIAFFVYYFRKRIILQKSAGVGLAGILPGLLGVGCASCGSVILTSLIGLTSTTAFLGVLPFRGQEFGILSIIIFTISISFIAKKINDPLVCKI